MLAFALLSLTCAADPVDAVDAPPSASPAVHVTVKREIAVDGTGAPTAPERIAPLDDVVLRADIDRSDARFRWELVEKPAASSVVLVHDDGAVQSFRFYLGTRRVPGVDVAGTYRVRVTAITGDGAASAETAFVVASAPHKPTAPPPDQKAAAQSARQTIATGAVVGCLAGAAGTAAVALTGGFMGTLAIVCAVPCLIGSASAGACAGTQLVDGAFDALAPWLLCGGAVALLGVAGIVGGALVGVTLLGGGSWYITEAPAFAGVAVLLSAPLITVVGALATAPDEVLARGAR